MSYVDAISNALAARGNALAQGELQRGAVYGNLARNLGEIPGQAIAFHQQRMDALQNTELKKMALEKAQRNAEMDKEAVRIVHSGLPDEQIFTELERLWSGDPDKFVALQNMKAQHLMRQQQQLVSYNATRQNTPGTVAPQGGYALPMPTRGETVPGGGVGNAFEPVTPISEQMVHPTIQSAYGPLNAQTAAQVQGRKDITTEATAARNLKNQMALAEYKQKLKPAPVETEKLTSQATPDRKSSTGWRWMQWDSEKNSFSIRGNEAPPPASVVSAANVPTVTIITKNEKGEPVTKVLTKTEALKMSKEGGGIARAPAAMTLNRIVAAQNSLNMGQEVLDYLKKPEVQAGLGPAMGRVTSFRQLIGNPPPELAELSGMLKSWSELQPAVHGMRSSEMAEHIEKAIGSHLTPEALAGFINGFQRTAETVAFSEDPSHVPSTGALSNSTMNEADYGPVQEAILDGKPARVRKNLKTGKYRKVD